MIYVRGLCQPFHVFIQIKKQGEKSSFQYSIFMRYSHGNALDSVLTNSYYIPHGQYLKEVTKWCICCGFINSHTTISNRYYSTLCWLPFHLVNSGSPFNLSFNITSSTFLKSRLESFTICSYGPLYCSW